MSEETYEDRPHTVRAPWTTPGTRQDSGDPSVSGVYGPQDILPMSNRILSLPGSLSSLILYDGLGQSIPSKKKFKSMALSGTRLSRTP